MTGLLLIMLAHFAGDFLMQTRTMGRMKSKHAGWLMLHVLFVSLTILAAAGLVMDVKTAIIFTLLNAAAHAITDVALWRLYAFSAWKRRHNTPWEKLPMPKEMGSTAENVKVRIKTRWKYWEDPLFYHTIGFDQFLHYAAIILLYGWLS
jgi:hypothetical protein